jgi:rhamnogalacturonyl hydrolase YesR
MRAYQAYGNPTWLEGVKGLIVENNKAYDPTCGGGLWWKWGNYYEKNTITNTLHFSILTRLYRFTGTQQYLTDAIATLEWWLGWAFEPATGQIWDSIETPGCIANRSGLESWTYNSGAVLFGLADLYEVTGDEKLLDMGRTISYAAMGAFSVDASAVIEERCEHDAPTYPGGPAGCGDDFLAVSQNVVSRKMPFSFVLLFFVSFFFFPRFISRN